MKLYLHRMLVNKIFEEEACGEGIYKQNMSWNNMQINAKKKNSQYKNTKEKGE
jgi:hypothetical protein